MTRVLWTQEQDIGPGQRFSHAIANEMKGRSSLLTVGADSHPAGLFACSTLGHLGPARPAGSRLERADGENPSEGSRQQPRCYNGSLLQQCLPGADLSRP